MSNPAVRVPDSNGSRETPGQAPVRLRAPRSHIPTTDRRVAPPAPVGQNTPRPLKPCMNGPAIRSVIHATHGRWTRKGSMPTTRHLTTRHLKEKGLRGSPPALAGRDLACWCAPALCHGDVLARYAAIAWQVRARRETLVSGASAGRSMPASLGRCPVRASARAIGVQPPSRSWWVNTSAPLRRWTRR